jgi:predicted small lipoprotein YifL
LREFAVISKTHYRSVVRIVAMLACASWLGGCGFKGPLYMPGKPEILTPVVSPYSMYGAYPEEDSAIIPFFDEDLTLLPTPVVIE